MSTNIFLLQKITKKKGEQKKQNQQQQILIKKQRKIPLRGFSLRHYVVTRYAFC